MITFFIKLFIILHLFILCNCSGNFTNEDIYNDNNPIIHQLNITPITSTFVNEELCYQTPTVLEEWFKELVDLRIDTIIINNYITVKDEFRHKGITSWNIFRKHCEMPQLLHTILQLADKYNIKVYIGTVAGMFIADLFYEEPISSLIYESTIIAVQEILYYYNNYSSFVGWYIADEPAIGCWDINNTSITQHYKRINNYIKLVDPKKRQTTVSPYICGASVRKTPRIVGENAAIFMKETGIDILIWQDGVGAFTLDPTEASLYLREIENSVGKERLWVLIELFEDLCSYQCSNQNYNASNIDKLKIQLAINAYYGTKVTCWAQTHHLSSVIPTSLKYGGDRLKEEYLKILYDNMR